MNERGGCAGGVVWWEVMSEGEVKRVGKGTEDGLGEMCNWA